MDRFVYLKDVVTLHLDDEQCVGCGMCTIVCPQGVFSLQNGNAKIVHRDSCMECGACSTNCPAGAISVQTGVGCAAAVINSMLGLTDSSCCCVIEQTAPHSIPKSFKGGTKGSGCC
jgi:NAD-dependent dihydropyrimidine dehydrogenase PreA subunit